MKVIVARSAGFCMGVRRAVETTLDLLNRHEDGIATFGPLIHNPQVLNLLHERGVRVLEEIPAQLSGTVVIRAHGVPPAQKNRLREVGAQVLDGTCPRVIKVQAIINKYRNRNFEAVIIGDRNHAEVEGLMGYAGSGGHVVSKAGDVDDLHLKTPYIIVSQTTQDENVFQKLSSLILARFPDGKVFNTICDSTHKRQEEVRTLCERVEAVVVVGGRTSANTQRLGEIAQGMQRPVFMVETEEDLDLRALARFQVVGVTAGASTPTWMINRVVQVLEALPGPGGGRLGSLFYQFSWLLLATNFYISLGGGLLAYGSGLLQGIQPRLAHLVIAFGYLFAMHNVNRFLDQRAKNFSDPTRAVFYRKYRWPLLLASVGSLLLAFWTAVHLGEKPFLLLAGMSILGLLYQFRLIPKSLSSIVRIRRLKEIPGSKTFFVATAWALVTVLVPAWGSGQFLAPRTMGTMFFILLLAFIRNALLDVFEVLGDRIVGRETLPVFIGEQKTLKLLQILVWVLVLLPFLFPLLNLMSEAGYWLAGGGIYLAGLLYLYRKGALAQGTRLEFGLESTFYLMAGLPWLAHRFF